MTLKMRLNYLIQKLGVETLNIDKDNFHWVAEEEENLILVLRR